MQDKIKLPRIISSWKSERKLWLKFQLNQSIFLFLSLKSVIVNFGFLNLFFLDIWIQNPDPDSEYGSGSRIQAQIECGSNRIRIRIRIRNTAVDTIPTARWTFSDVPDIKHIPGYPRVLFEHILLTLSSSLGKQNLHYFSIFNLFFTPYHIQFYPIYLGVKEHTGTVKSGNIVRFFA